VRPASTARADSGADLELELHPKQSLVFDSPATEILYGGAAGGGKSHLLRVAMIAWCVAIQGLQCYLFRRTYPELISSHLEGPGSFLEILAPWIEHGYAKVNISSLDIQFPANRSAIHLRHCQYETDLPKYQSAEIHALGLDEVTHFTERMYRFLRSRVRLGSLAIPEVYRGRFPRVIVASNPGGIGHNWVKASWIDPKPAGEVWRAPIAEGGMLRQFIAARLEDNPTLVENDPDYAAKLSGLGSAELVRAMLEGDWNIVAGGALDDVWNPVRHVVSPFPIPADWSVDRSFDWGSSKPFSVGWWAESNGEEVEIPGRGKVSFARGTLFRIAELYGWNGRPNEGCRKIATEVARDILVAEKAMGLAGRVAPGPADSSIFAVENGTSIADDMARVGVQWIPAEKGPGSRKNGLERVRKFLKASLSSPMEEPGLLFFATCRHAIRTLPTLPRDVRQVDDVDSDAEDHVFDETRYRVMHKRRAGGSLSSVSLIGV
jgi:hypothetical protein